ncbi:MAG: hypothetical protein J5855_00475 [Mailhella sp.]|nr:hypothetical protein [Mailhella sp.]
MLKFSQIMALGAVMLLGTPIAQAVEQPQEWELLQPMGVIQQSSVQPAKPLTSLEGKTIALRWNGKNNGDVVLNHLAELLAKDYPSAKLIKVYEKDISTIGISGANSESDRMTKSIAGMKPDLVIASQCD